MYTLIVFWESTIMMNKIILLLLATTICTKSVAHHVNPDKVARELDKMTFSLLVSVLENPEAQRLLQNCASDFQQGGAHLRIRTCTFTDIKGSIDGDIIGKLDPILCYWLKFAQHKFKHVSDQPLRNHLLLYGPTGNGKTFIADKLTKLSGWKKVHRFGSSIAGEYIGTAQANINNMFNEADDHLKADPDSGVVIIIDGIEHIAGDNEHEAKFDHNAGCAELWQRLDQYAQHPRVLFIAITNHYEKLDAIFLNRFNNVNKVFLDNPDAASRQEIFIKTFSTVHATIKPTDPQLQKLVDMTDGLSIRMLQGIVGSVKVVADLDHDGKISWDLIMETATCVVEDHKKMLLHKQADDLARQAEEYQKRLNIFLQIHQAILIDFINEGIKKNGSMSNEEKLGYIKTAWGAARAISGWFF